MLNIAFGSTALGAASLAFLFIAHIRFLAADSLITVLRKRYGRHLINEVKTLEKIDFKLKKAVMALEFLISCRKIVFSRYFFSSKFLINSQELQRHIFLVKIIYLTTKLITNRKLSKHYKRRL